MSRPRSQRSRNEEEAARWRLENSPFWLTDEPRDAGPDTDGTGRDAAVTATRPLRFPTPAPTGPGLTALVVLALVAAFFSWVSAEPFWLAVGHAEHGVAAVTACTGTGVTQRCTGTFTTTETALTVDPVTLLGVTRPEPGATAPARMVDAAHGRAYVGPAGLLMHLRWTLGFLLVALCGIGVSRLTGARRLATATARRRAVLLSFTGPAALLIGFLIAAY